MEDRVDFIYALQRKIMKENIDKFTEQLDKYTEVSILVRLSYSNNIFEKIGLYACMGARQRGEVFEAIVYIINITVSTIVAD